MTDDTFDRLTETAKLRPLTDAEFDELSRHADKVIPVSVHADEAAQEAVRTGRGVSFVAAGTGPDGEPRLVCRPKPD